MKNKFVRFLGYISLITGLAVFADLSFAASYNSYGNDSGAGLGNLTTNFRSNANNVTDIFCLISFLIAFFIGRKAVKSALKDKSSNKENGKKYSYKTIFFSFLTVFFLALPTLMTMIRDSVMGTS